MIPKTFMEKYQPFGIGRLRNWDERYVLRNQFDDLKGVKLNKVERGQSKGVKDCLYKLI